MNRFLVLSAVAGLLAGTVSCGVIKRLVSPKPEITTRAPEVPPQFRRGGGGARGGDPITNVNVGDAPVVVDPDSEVIVSRERDLVWTDPDNPDQELQGMEQVIKQNAKKGPWRVSFSEARREAVRSGKPLVVWFTNSQMASGPGGYLSAEVFSTANFGKWAEKEAVRVRLDFNVKGSGMGLDDQMDDRLRKEKYLAEMKKRYKVLGLPTVLVMAPDGTVTGNYRGYDKSYGDFYFARLQRAAEMASKHHEEWMAKMERRGYREWNDTKGRSVFAKLSLYREGQLLLTEPDGHRLKAKERNLSSTDRAWIAAEKAKRER